MCLYPNSLIFDCLCFLIVLTMDSSTIELLKENVQPLKSGRKADNIRSALSTSQMDSELREKTRAKYENDLKELKDEELLNAYYSYIEWIEQNYIENRREANFNKIINKCVTLFVNKKEYANNEKLLSVVLRYFNILTNPMDAIKALHKIGFGRKLAGFYIAWSFFFESQNNSADAAKVLKIGLKYEAEPAADLKKALEDLEVRIMRNVMNNSPEQEKTDGERKALNCLKTRKLAGGKLEVPVIRQGNYSSSKQPLRTLSVATSERKTNAPLQVFTDENEGDADAEINDAKDVKSLFKNPENEIKAGKWTDNKLKTRSHRTQGGPKFSVYCEDEKEDENNITVAMKENADAVPVASVATTKIVNQPKVAEKEQVWPVAKFESDKEMKKYCWYHLKDEIYRDQTEFSFEELRFAKWLETKKAMIAGPSPNQSMAKGGFESMVGEHTNMLRYQFWEGTLNANEVTTTECAPYARSYLNDTTVCEPEKNVHAFKIFEETTTQVMPNIAANLKMEEGCENGDDENANKLENTLSVTGLQKAFDVRPCSTPNSSRLLHGYRSNFPSRNFVVGITEKIPYMSPVIEVSRESNQYKSSSSSSSGSTILNTPHRSSDNASINPFDQLHRSNILEKLSTPIELRQGYQVVKELLPAMDINEIIAIDHNQTTQEMVIIKQELKTSSIERYKAGVNNVNSKLYTLTIYRGLNYWEFYILDELKKRLAQASTAVIANHSLVLGKRIIFYNDGHIMLENNRTFTLEEAMNKLEAENVPIPDTFVYFLALELMLIIIRMHDCGILHSAIEPANIAFLSSLSSTPDKNVTKNIKLINFESAIDLKVFPKGTVFNKNFKKDDTYSVLETRHWNYLIDWIGFLNCLHMLKMGGRKLKIVQHQDKLMVYKENEEDSFGLLEELFDYLLNLEADQMPNLYKYIEQLYQHLDTETHFDELGLFINNILSLDIDLAVF